MSSCVLFHLVIALKQCLVKEKSLIFIILLPWDPLLES